MYFGVVNTGYATSFFIPTILTQLGWTAIRAQVMSIPIYIASASVCLLTAVCTDRLKHRYSFTMLGVLIATAGYAILLAPSATTATVPVSLRYAATYLVVVGCYVTQPVVLAWLANNVAGHYKRGIAAAVQIGFGNVGGIVASNIFVKDQAPAYPLGFGVSLGLLWLCGLACTVFVVGLWWENRRRERGGRLDRLRLEPREVENLGDDHPSFRFTY